MVSPQAQRQGVRYLTEEWAYSQRRARGLVGMARSSARYQTRREPEEAELRAHLRQLAGRRQTYGCPRIAALLRREGYQVNQKRVHRLWKEEKGCNCQGDPGNGAVVPKERWFTKQNISTMCGVTTFWRTVPSKEASCGS